MSEAYDFNEKLELAEKWEELLEPVLGELMWETASRVNYEENPDAQLSGIDHVLKERSFDGLQTKVITKKYDNIFYETVSVVEREKEGWVYEYTNHAVLWCWLSDSKTRIVDARWLLINDDFREWFDSHKERYGTPRHAPSIRDGKEWTTRGITIPLDKIPRGFIRPADKAVGLKTDTEQTEILNFEDG